MRGIKKTLRKLFSLGLISKKQEIESDYDLLNEILKKRSKNKKKLDNLSRINLELDAYLEIIEDKSLEGLYNEEELKQIYETIIS
ncbi:hypothetical protein [Tenacibaculum maritimum]|uniref:hypothetical protein n=1 Tax=Tenacibaculum maritimum TaxID=107401 RepID=UPI0012E67498|nr:hypothetical protein [Tenacibaculum maritimum]CAA0247661.1 conserved hypothetical protein [Tenacibaculum maritimum]